MKRKITALCLVVALLAVAIVGGTMAYFTDTDSATNVFTVGSIDIELTEPDWDPNEKPDIVPGNSYAKDPKLTNKGKSDAYVRIEVNVNNPQILRVLAGVDKTFDITDDTILRTIVDIQDGWTFDNVLVQNGTMSFYYNYDEILTPGAVTPDLFTRVMIPTSLKQTPEVQAIAGEDFILTINGQAIQADGFATKEAAFAALDSELAIAGVTPSQSGNNNDFENALSQDTETIVVDLTADVTYDVAPWANDAMGGTATTNIIINGNGHQITFNQTSNDWNNIVTNNDAKLTINNAKLTNSGYNDGPWDRHDLNFACEVVLNDVVSDKAMAFMAGATLNNVTIDDANTSDTYAIWIQPNGQTVTLNGCTIDMLDCTDGRGIKIDDQYVSAPQKVTLNVTNTTFKTEEKAAILVNSTAGADININNVNIAGVAADSTNAVWVDDASKTYASLVTVNGARVIVEPAAVAAQADFSNALLSGQSVEISTAGTYRLPTTLTGNKSVTISGTRDVVIDATTASGQHHGLDITFDGVTVQYGTALYKGLQHAAKVVYKDCKIIGLQFLYAPEVEFIDCEFDSNGAQHSVWTYSAENISFTNCAFTYSDRAINAYCEKGDKQNVTFENCTFTATNTSSLGAVEVNSSKFTTGINVTLTGCTAPAYGPMAFVPSYDTLNGEKTTITIN